MTSAAGLVLAGGNATRLGGGDKTLRLVGGRPMLAHILDRLAPQASPLAISANGDPARFAAFGLEVLADEMPAGPLAGILAGMRWADRLGAGRLVTVAGDTPFFPRDMTAALAGEADRTGRIAVAASAGRSHPVFALWPTKLAAALETFLERRESFSVQAFLAGHDAVTVDFPPAAELDPFFNVNTPDDLARAQTLLERQP